MSPIVSLIIKQLPGLIPVVESLVRKAAAPSEGDDRLDSVEQSLERLIERTRYVEARIRRTTLAAVFAMLLALAALIAAFVR